MGVRGRWVLIVASLALVLPSVSGPHGQPARKAPDPPPSTGCPPPGDPVDPSGPPVSSPATTGRASLPLPDDGCAEGSDPLDLDRVRETADELVEPPAVPSR